MRAKRERLTVTVDPDLIEAGNRAVAAGWANSLSGWVNGALQFQVSRERKLQHLMGAVADYESEFGEITTQEMGIQRRADRGAAHVVRGQPS